MLKEVSIEIIRKCPNCCMHCSSMSHKQCKEIMPYNKFIEVISDASRLGTKTICLSGGEPFLHPDIVDMVKSVSNYGMDCYVYTSGIVMDAFSQSISLSTDMLKQISRYITKLIFNIEAGTESTYDRIMGTHHCFEIMQQSAIHAAEAGICTEAHFVPMALNVDEIDSVISLCEKLQISKLSFLRLVLHGRAKQNRNVLALTDEKIKALKNHLYDLQAKSNISIRIGVPLSLNTSCHKCEAANGKLNIKYDGEVYPCEVFKNYSMEKSLGDLKPDNIYQCSLAKIFESSQYLQFVRTLSSKFSDTNGCETCIGQHLIEKEENNESRW